jgi:Flp pilus assembly protein TadD
MGIKTPGWTDTIGWPILIAAVMLLSGCGDAGVFSKLPFGNESSARTLSADTGTALRLARATRQAGDLNASVQLYRNLVASRSVTPDVEVEFGDVLVEVGSPDDAIDIFGQIDSRSPARLGALLGLTRAYLNLSEPAKALEYANEAQGLAPHDARVLVDKGVALDTLNRHAEAQELYRAVLVILPRHVSARNNLALSLALTGRYDEALALMGPLVRSSSATSRERENMAMIYGLMGDADHATMLSRVDLDEATTRSNLIFFTAVRGSKP